MGYGRRTPASVPQRVLLPLAARSALALLCLAAPAGAATVEQTYRAKCSICHDSGAGNAPRLSQKAEWTDRVTRGRAALYARTLDGVPNTPMAAKGGFAELTDAEARALVDYMLRASGHGNTPMQPVRSALTPGRGPGGDAAVNPVPATTAPLTDQTISAAVASRLRAQLGKPDMLLDPYEGVITIRGIGIKVETHAGVTTLSGVLHDAELIPRAERIAAGMPGVRGVINRMISGAMLDFD